MTVKSAQAALAAAGFDPGPIDGIWGGKSDAALTAALAAIKAPGSNEAASADPNDALLAAELLRDEGFVSHAYKDTKGYLTIGIGRLIDERKGGGITREEALYLKRNDIARFKAELDRVAPWWRDLDPVRQRVILNMTFNMGPGWVDTFKNTVRAIREGRWQDAASGMLASQWHKDVGERAERLAAMMLTGRV